MAINDIWSYDASTALNNSTVGSVNVAENAPFAGMNDAFRELTMQIRRICNQGSAIASAATCSIAATGTSFYVHITGTTTITSFNTANAGVWRWVVFDGALTLTHNATSLILPGGASITTAAGDCALFASEGSGNWRCLAYSKASGKAAVTTVALADIANDLITYAKIQNVSATNRLLGRSTAGAGDIEEIGIGAGFSLGSTTLTQTGPIQVVFVSSQTHVTDTNNIPVDNSIPQSSEGTQLFSQAFTPLSASSTIVIDVSLSIGATTAGSDFVGALFKDAGANAVACGIQEGASNGSASLHFSYSEASGSTSSRTYKVRFGMPSGTAHINGNVAGDTMGGTFISSMKITEFL